MAGGVAYIPTHARWILVASLVLNIVIGILVLMYSHFHKGKVNVTPWPQWLSWFVLIELIIYSFLDLAHNATHFI